MMEYNLETKAVLKQYLDETGNVNYNNLRQDQFLKEQLQILQKTNVDLLSRDEEFVFWLNAYNLLTLKAVSEKLDVNPNWKGNKGYWAKFKFFVLTKHKIGNKKISLYTLENKILRKKFKDPRIHFGINCASKSCPVLPGRLYTVQNIEDDLNTLTENFLEDEKNITLDEENNILYLSLIFKWYKNDFKESGGVLNFIKKYWNGPKDKLDLLNHVKIRYNKYDWSLNSQ